MTQSSDRAIAIVGVGAVLPDAPNAPAFWQNIVNKRYSIYETPANRWSIADYYDPDPSTPDKSYSKLGGWVQGFQFDWKKYRVPPKVAAAMDEGQQWAVTIADEALTDYGYPNRPLDPERLGVILGTAMGGEQHYTTQNRIIFPEFVHMLEGVPEFAGLPAGTRETIMQGWHGRMDAKLPPITEDTMPGELPNIVAGRVANVLNLRGPNFITDAACASSFAAISSAFEMLTEHHVDAVIAGGVDRNMGAAIFVKFCKIGALSATGSRPFGEGADGFVMGEGSASFLLKRLSDAERDGDKIYAVIRGVGASSDGKGKGITAPNPIGQILAARRAWQNAELDPATATLLEAHGTSTKVGDVTEVNSLTEVFGGAGRQVIGLGSAKSNIGHLKAGAGAAGLLKATMAIHSKLLPPTLNCERPNPNIDFANSPFYLLCQPRAWEAPKDSPRRAGVSAYGFGGTNFHLVLEEHVPGMLKSEPKVYAAAVPTNGQANGQASAQVESDTGKGDKGKSDNLNASSSATPRQPLNKKPLRGIYALGAKTPTELKDKLDEAFRKVEGGWTPDIKLPNPADLRQPERIVLDFGNHDELFDKLGKARKAAGFDNVAAWKALQAQGIFRASGDKPGKIGFLFPGQGSQYSNMGRLLASVEPVVAATFKEADQVMTPILGKPLTSYIFVDSTDPEAMKKAERDLMQTAITQPAMLTMDTAIYKLLGEFGMGPDMVMGHSLGEYGALIAAGIMPFADALEASAARGAEMTKVSMGDNGWMAAVMAPLDVVEQTLREVDGYAVAANINSYTQAVVGGASKAVEQAIAIFEKKGFRAQRIPVSHAFHTKIVAPASAPLRQVLNRLRISEPKLPMVANVTGGLYPETVEGIKDILELQIASPVQWVKGLETMYAEGVRMFVEVGPKRALKGFVDDVLGSKPDVWSLLTNHPKSGEIETFNQALCGLYAAGYGIEALEGSSNGVPANGTVAAAVQPAPVAPVQAKEGAPMAQSTLDAGSLGQALVAALQQISGSNTQHNIGNTRYDRNDVPQGSIVVSGTGLGLPGANKQVMDPDNAQRILRGEQFVDLIPERYRKEMASKRITRVVKGEDGSGSFEVIESTDDVIKLAGRGGAFDLAEEYGVPAKLIEALDITTQLAIAAGIDALREAGIPLVQTYRTTTKGTYLPDRWLLPEALRDETGVIFASAFPGGDRFANEFKRYYAWENLRQQIVMLEELRQYVQDDVTLREINRKIGALKDELVRTPYEFDRRFIFRILAMGHSQFAEYIGARGPNTHVNAACASTAQGISLAEDWIRSGRCRRVIVLGADDVTSDNLMGWVGAGFLATGAAATDDKVDEAALPFDRRRHGTLLGMGACALVVESEDAVRERGMRGVVELLSSETANSAFHGTRLDVSHICDVMDRLVTGAERRFGINRYSMAPQMAFISHETYTPARGGSAAAEVFALRNTFGAAADEIVVCNTKGFTGHPMGAGVEDVIAVKILEYGIVPPVPNYKEVDPDLGSLNLSRGGRYPVQYALHLAAGFGSQISMTLLRRIPGSHDRVDNKGMYQRWLSDVSGYDTAETEVAKRVLRVVATGAPGRRPVASTWQYGTGPIVRATVPGNGVMTEYKPLPMPAVTRPASPVAPAAPVAPVPAPAAPQLVAPPAAPAPAPVAPKPAPAPVAQPAPVPMPVAVAPVAPAPAAPAPSVPAADKVIEQVLSVVAAKTGYPQDMLDLDLDLEADLGIDTVKQAETFAAIRESFAIPVQEGINLRDYPTLQAVVGYVKKNRPDLAVAAPAATAPAMAPVAPATQPTAAVSAVPAVDMVVDKVLNVVAEKTGYPKDMLDLDLDLEADLGIDTVKQAETFAAIRESFAIPALEGINLRDYPTLSSVVGFVRSMRPDLAVAAMPAPPAPKLVTAPTAAPVAAATQSAPVAPAGDPVIEQVLGVVADKTGYPKDMLELDLDMEADLGIDTVKQAETFAAIRETFAIPVQEGINLRDYPTLKSVVEFVKQMRPDLAVSVAVAPAALVGEAAVPATSVTQPAAAAPVTSATDPVVEKVLDVVANKTGYPKDMLELDLDMEADLGIDTVKQAETFAAIRESFAIPVQEGLNLRDYPTLSSVVGFVRSMRPDLAVAVATAPASPAAPIAAETQLAAAAARVTAPAGDAVTEKVLEVVAAKTGYPKDMLELDLDMEADLGIDTVKQAETFASIRESFEIPLQEGINLRDYPTLSSVVEFVKTMRPDLAAAAPVARATAAASTVEGAASVTQSAAALKAAVKTIGTLEDADKMPRRVPVPALRPSLDVCKPTGVVLDGSSRVVVMLDQGGIGKKLVEKLQKRGATVLVVEPGVGTDALDTQLKAWQEDGRIQGVYWLSALDVEQPLEDMSLEEWRELNRVRVKNLYTAMRALYDSVAGPNSFLISATRLGGLHGYGHVPAAAALGGAVVGFTKAYNMEQAMRDNGKGITVKAVDFEPSRKTVEPADQLIAETLLDPGIVEVGYYEGQRYTVTLEELPAKDGQPGMVLDKSTVFVVTGAAGGITSAITTDLAVASSGVFYLLDLVGCPARDDKYVGYFRQGREALKQALIAEAKASGEKVTPAQIDKKMMDVERSEAALRAVEAVEAAGGTAHYFSLDLRDGEAVSKVVEDIRQRYGKIDVLLHAGGLLIDKILPNKEPHQFALVFDVKADGFFSLVKAAKGMPIGATVSFSSVAGRFGNNGQSDYSSANDLLCKISSSMRSWRPETRGIAIDWTAWGQIGMASRGSVQAILESLGVDMLPPEAGVPTIRRELTYGGTRGELVVAGRLGAWLAEKDPTGGLDVDKVNAQLAQRQNPLLMVGEVKSYRLYGGIEVETTLDPKAQPFLFDHAPDAGQPWLPGVMATEALAEVALAAAPGYRVAAVENEQMLGAFKFFRMEPRTLYLSATVKPVGNGELMAHAVLRSVTKPAKEGLPTQVKEHFIADVRLTQAALEKPAVGFSAPAEDSLPIEASEIYKSFFHGPTYQVIERARVSEHESVALMAHDLGPNTEPANAESVMAPRLVELCFQAAALWNTKVKNAMAFPLGFEAVTAYRQPEEAEGRRLYCVCKTHNDGVSFDAQVTDEAGNIFVVLKSYLTVSRPA